MALTKKQNQKRYRLHACLKKKGFIIHARKRKILVHGDENLKQLTILKDEFQYNLQLEIK